MAILCRAHKQRLSYKFELVKKGKKIDKESLFKMLNKCEHVKLTYLTSKSGNALNKKQSCKSGMSDLASKLVLKGPLLISDPYSVWCLDSWAAHKTGYQRFTKLITYIWAKDTETHNSVIIEYSGDPNTGLVRYSKSQKQSRSREGVIIDINVSWSSALGRVAWRSNVRSNINH